jgi:hypothetical protein
LNLISFAIWGQDPKYLIGAIKNADLAQEIYPNWLCRFYVAASVPEQIISILESKPNVQVVRREDWGDWRSSFWRFEPLSEEGVDVLISRDCDSRLNKREKGAVLEWIESEYDFHIMKDHPWHFTYPILAGMFGCKKNVIESIQQKINSYNKTNWYHTDQEFLKHEIYQIIEQRCLIHDSINKTGKKFPSLRNGYEFVGESYDENDQTIVEHTDVLKKFLS